MKDNPYKRMARRMEVFNLWEAAYKRNLTPQQTARQFRELYASMDHLPSKDVDRAQDEHLQSLIAIQRAWKRDGTRKEKSSSEKRLA